MFVFQVPLVVPILALGLTTGLFILGAYQKPMGNLMAIGLIVSGLPLYAIFVMWSPKPKAFNSWICE